MTHAQTGPSSLDELRRLLADRAESPPDAGPPNRYHDAAFHKADPADGTLSDAHGGRSVRLSPAELAGLLGALDAEALYRAGRLAGLRDLADFVPRFEAEAGRPLAKVNLGRALQSWWWPMRARGWGTWRFDLRHHQRGLILATLRDAPLAGRDADGLAAFLAGFFCAPFGLLAGRDLHGLPLPPLSPVGDEIAFLISTAKTVRAARALLEQGTPPAELIDRLTPPDRPS